VYALTAYVLNLNDILPPDATLDQASLLKVVMPNRNGFTTAHGFMRKDGKPDVANAACMRDCPVEAKIASQIPDYAHDLHGDVARQSQRMAAAPASAPAARELAQRSGCTACHGVDTRIVGPGFRQVAARYGQDPAAEAKLVAKLKSGGAGSWGKTPMPSQGHLPDADLHRLAQWVLSGAN
jgi:cytochrome c